VPRFYFDVRDGDRFTPDKEGLDLSSVVEARTDASRALAQMVKDVMPDGDCREMAIEVRGEDKSFLFKVQMTFKVDGDPL
jgi:hypothetical protein